MSSLNLVLWISLGVSLQLLIYLGISFWKHWRSYQALLDRAVESDIPLARDAILERQSKVSPAWIGLRTFRVERKEVADDQVSIRSFFLVPEDGQALPAFLPGQFLTFELEIPAGNGASNKFVRCYSISDAPNPYGYRISIKRALPPRDSDVPEGRVSNFFHDQVQLDTRLQVRAPAGHFYLDQSMNPIVLIAGGIGITPMMSMLDWSLTQQAEREIWLFYGVRNSRELMMKSHLEALAAAYPNFHLRLCFSDEIGTVDEVDGNGIGYRYRGRIGVDLLRRQLPLKPFHYYICGPTALLESLVPALEEWGVQDGRIHFEAFGPASIKRKKSALPLPDMPQEKQVDSAIVVNFTQSGKQVSWRSSAGNLLDFAETNGLVVNSGCRSGSCGSCQTTILAGEVSYIQPPDFDPEVGTCLLCVCTPKTNVSLEI